MEELLEIGREIVAALERCDHTEARRLAASLMGKISSPRKAASSAENGRRGGRPAGTVLSAETKERISAAHARRAVTKQAEGGGIAQTVRGPGRPRNAPVAEGPKRGRGRPPKNTPEPEESR